MALITVSGYAMPPVGLRAAVLECFRSCLPSQRCPPRTSSASQPGSSSRVFLDEHRSEINDCLDGLTEEQARRSLVPSRTTLLGLVKHATFVEKVWFDEATGHEWPARRWPDIGIPATPDESFILHDGDTIATVRQAHREACEASRRATSSMGLDDMVRGGTLAWPAPALALEQCTSTYCASSSALRGLQASCESSSSAACCRPVPVRGPGRAARGFALTVEHGPGLTIYRRAICASCRTEQEVAEQVRRTVIHEVAHHFGIDDRRLRELGW